MTVADSSIYVWFHTVPPGCNKGEIPALCLEYAAHELRCGNPAPYLAILAGRLPLDLLGAKQTRGRGSDGYGRAFWRRHVKAYYAEKRNNAITQQAYATREKLAIRSFKRWIGRFPDLESTAAE